MASPDQKNVPVPFSDSSGGTAKFRLKNWSTGQWEEVDSDSLGTTEIVRKKTGISSTNYIRTADGAIEFSFLVTAVVSSLDGLTGSIDQVKIVVKD